MRLGKEQCALLALVRAGLWEQPPTETDGLFRLPATAWGEVLAEARRQTVAGIACHGLQHLPDRLLPPLPLLTQWVAETDGIERRNRLMNQVLDELYTLFRRAGLNAVLLKGQGVARMYGSPLLRTCGDIDFCFQQPAEWETARTLIERTGCPTTPEADGSLFYRWKGIEVEHHPRLCELRSPALQRTVRQLAADTPMQETELPHDTPIAATVPPPALNLLLLSTHILKHVLGRGIGLRQLCDMACACRRYPHTPEAMNELRLLYRRTGLERWGRLLDTFLVQYLGMPDECSAYPPDTEGASLLLDIVLRGGNFGQYHLQRVQAVHTPAWRHKWDTAAAFWHNSRFACRYAPHQALHTFIHLTLGQWK